jgi:anti-anti-sigma factor
MLDVEVAPDRAVESPPPFACSATTGGRALAWVYVAGELDVATTPQLVRTLRDCLRRARVVVLDLREVTSMDTCAVHAIVGASVRARHHARRLVLLRGPLNVDRLFAGPRGADRVEFGDVDALEPPTRVAWLLLQAGAGERAA